MEKRRNADGRAAGENLSLARLRWNRFKSVRRAYASLVALGVAFAISLLGPLVAGDKPLLMKYEGRLFVPVFAFHSDAEFGGSRASEADYLALKARPDFAEGGNWMVFPIVPHDPLRRYIDAPEPPPHAPSAEHWLGTDGSARDVLSRLIHGFRVSMLFALSLVTVSALFGVLAGGLQGFLGGRFDLAAQRFVEIWSALPFLYVVILVGAVFGRSFGMLLLSMALFEWIGLSYYMRGEFLRLRNFGYVRSARALGMGRFHVFVREILPNAMTPVVTLLPFNLIGGIGSLTALDFLGFGLQPPTPSWGELLAQGLQHLYAPWIAGSVVAALFVTLLLATFVGEGARTAFDPKAERR